jgi:proteasome lid subunit RPN8/RPN11
MIDKIELPYKTQRHIQECACEVFPNELCGFILPDLSFVKVDNIAIDKHKSFTINAIDRLYYHDAIAIVHTHTISTITHDPRTPSISDCEGQVMSGLPWLIYACDGDYINREPVQIPRYHNPELLGRSFIAGYSDCYALVQDYYYKYFDISLKEHTPYTVRDILRGRFTFNNLLMEQYNFEQLTHYDELQDGDIVVLQQGINQDNHIGVIHDSCIIHQSEISISEPFETMVGRVQKYYRYKDLV